MNNKLLIGILALSASLSTGCATIVSGSTQDISVSSVPPGATVTAMPGSTKATTPGVLTLHRKDGPYNVTFSLDGYNPYTVSLTADTNGWVFGNIVLGGGLISVVGLLIDTDTGASLKLSPDEINANLIKSGEIPQSSNRNVLYVFNEKQTLLGVLELK